MGFRNYWWDGLVGKRFYVFWFARLWVVEFCEYGWYCNWAGVFGFKDVWAWLFLVP